MRNPKSGFATQNSIVSFFWADEKHSPKPAYTIPSAVSVCRCVKQYHNIIYFIVLQLLNVEPSCTIKYQNPERVAHETKTVFYYYIISFVRVRRPRSCAYYVRVYIISANVCVRRGLLPLVIIIFNYRRRRFRCVWKTCANKTVARACSECGTNCTRENGRRIDDLITFQGRQRVYYYYARRISHGVNKWPVNY